MIEAIDLCKSFDDTVALDGVGFTVSAGETFGLLGPNGAGKSTTINILTGILAPDSGELSIDGGNPSDSTVRVRIGNSPQTIALYDTLTAEENLAFFGRLYQLSRSRLAERVDYALDLAGLSTRRSDRVETFSGGMKRRLNLAAAMIHDPKILLLDEPTVGVDPHSRNLIFEKIEHLKSQGRTIIYTTHYMEEAQRLCDRVAIIDHGKILALDTVESLIAKYGGRSTIEGELASMPDNPAAIPGVLDGLKLSLETQRPLEDIARLAKTGARFSRLRIDGGNLEAVFLNLTGTQLRDE